MKYFAALVAIVVGMFLIIKTEWFIENFGTNSWAEEHMGTSGGTRLFYKLVGLAMIVFAMLGVTGLLGNLIMATFGKLFGM